MRLYLKATKAFVKAVFFPDHADTHGFVDFEGTEWPPDPYKSNVFKRYWYYIVDDLMIVDDATGRYTRCRMPMPLSIPGRIYCWVSYKWEHYQSRNY